MVYQLKLIDQSLQGLTREMAIACWQAVETLGPEPSGTGLYRRLYRALKSHIAVQATAYRFCGAKGCDEGKPVLGNPEWHEVFAPGRERLHRYLLQTEQEPGQVVQGLVAAVVRVIAHEYPGRRWKGLARIVRGRVERVLHGRLYVAPRCGHTPLCEMNESADPWDASDAYNAT
jgi:hypothetical protein